MPSRIGTITVCLVGVLAAKTGTASAPSIPPQSVRVSNPR
jgi:hypothetical protein